MAAVSVSSLSIDNGTVSIVVEEIDGGGLYFCSTSNASSDDDFDLGNEVFVSTILRSLKVNAQIVDGISEVTMVQEFQTPEFFPANFESNKAVYQIPLDELAAVTKFRAEVEGRVIEAVVKEREEAEQDFEEAVNNGENAFLAEQIRADIFHISVGNIPMNKIVRITLVYVTTPETLGVNVVRFVFPTAVAPRYQPFESEESIPAGFDMINNDVQIKLDISMAASIDTVTSATHMIQFNLSNNSTQLATVHVIDENPTKRDVVILLKTFADFQPQIYVDSSAKYNSTAIMLSIVPDVSDDVMFSSKQEYIFIVDRSGSMNGIKMEQTKLALLYIISNLPEGCIFNIIGFGSEFDPLFSDGSHQVSDKLAMDAALGYIGSMDANFGGTEILAPLQSVLESAQLPTYERLVFVLTDGEVYNTEDTITYVRSRQSAGRVFSLGIGEHVSALLVRGIARAGRGTAEFVDGDSMEAIESAVERQMEVALTPSLLDLNIKWGKQQMPEGQQAPFISPPLLTRKRYLVYYLIPGQNSVPDVVRLFSGSDIQYELNSSSFMHISRDDNDLIHKIACRSLIRDLEEGGSALHEMSASDEDIRKEIVRLGLKYQIASSETSFVAVDSEGWIEANGYAENSDDGTAGQQFIFSDDLLADDTGYWDDGDDEDDENIAEGGATGFEPYKGVLTIMGSLLGVLRLARHGILSLVEIAYRFIFRSPF